jgi:hypothetical protein
MICMNGEQTQYIGERGIFFICQDGPYQGNHCAFVRWCSKENHYVINNADCSKLIPSNELKSTVVK